MGESKLGHDVLRVIVVLQADVLGSSIALADSTVTIQTQYTFDPFGNTMQNGLGTSNSFTYTGRELDATGLYLYRASERLWGARRKV